jgi:NAD(P)-dependent dehydrogenase (short-subunit alcohol dehydrogenase family)
MLEKGSVTNEQLEEERKRYPLGFGDPTDIANGIIYLLSDAAKWVTGSVLTIDGGVTLR